MQHGFSEVGHWDAVMYSGIVTLIRSFVIGITLFAN